MRTGNIRVAEISEKAIQHNVHRIAELTGVDIIAVVKANAYGHGSEIVARAALRGGATMLGVADLEEALQLREAGIDAPILCWLHGTDIDFRPAVVERIEIGVSHLEQLERFADVARESETGSEPPTIQLKIDTGLSRNGAGAPEWPALFARVKELEDEGVLKCRGIFSHLANAGADADRAQAAVFDEAIALGEKLGLSLPMRHLSASAATLSSPHLRYNAVRVGVVLYGLSPFQGTPSSEHGLTPAMRLIGEVVQLRNVSAGTGVSYGYNYRTETDTTLALVPLGYADGLPRALNNAGVNVLVDGELRPIVGRIGMDQFLVDLGPELGARVSLGDKVVLFGDPEKGEPSVDEWAEELETINYEVVTGIGLRVTRKAV